MARKTLTHVEPEKFAEVRDKAGVKNIELAREMGVSPTRMTELTRTKGGTSRQLARVREAVRHLGGRRRADRLPEPIRAKRGGTSSSRSSAPPRRRSRALSPA